MKTVLVALVLVGLTMVLIGAYIRLAPVDPRVWHIPLLTDTREIEGACADGVTQGEGQAIASCSVTGSSEDLLNRLDAIALAHPNTRRIAGSAAEGRITWESRSAFWGFPDYITAQAESRGATTRLDVVARQRFGRNDWGVNATRLRGWLSQL